MAYFRYIDDLNPFNLSIIFEWDFKSDTKKSVEFLDVNPSLSIRLIVYDLHYNKPTDCHQFLPFSLAMQTISKILLCGAQLLG